MLLARVLQNHICIETHKIQKETRTNSQGKWSFVSELGNLVFIGSSLKFILFT